MSAENEVKENSHLKKAVKYFVKFIDDVLDLRRGVNPEVTIAEIKHNKSMSGANAWMLICSIMIASIGLSQNSQAVIIGAMLISPLMSPILGIGLSFGINDVDALRKSFNHFGIAITIALLTSTIFFAILPIEEVTLEISSRTSPTVLDILTAVFGGVAGIISIARKDLTTTLPGVAIATALMPPLCVTGFFISSGEWEMASRAFYLFFLNTFFVSLATYAIVRFLRFPYVVFPDRKRRTKNLLTMGLISLTIVIPSILIFKGVLNKFHQDVAIDRFVKSCLGDKKIYLDSYELLGGPEQQTLYLKVYGNEINNETLASYQPCIAEVGLTGVEIKIIPSSEVDLDHMKKIESELISLSRQVELVPDPIEFINRHHYNDMVNVDSVLFQELQDEIKILYPQVDEMAMGTMQQTDFDSLQGLVPTVLIKWETDESQTSTEEQTELREFMKVRMNIDNVNVIIY